MSLLGRHPRIGGLHVNIEPMPDGDASFVLLMEELKQAMPNDAILSVAAYPPPTVFHRFPEVHWSETYIGEISSVVDQMVFMMYDTGLQHEKLYVNLMKSWTTECFDWCGDGRTEVLLGLPAYDDAGSGYHYPEVENLKNRLLGIHAGLETYDRLPAHYSGAAIYSEWEMDSSEWELWRTGFLRAGSSSRARYE